MGKNFNQSSRRWFLGGAALGAGALPTRAKATETSPELSLLASLEGAARIRVRDGVTVQEALDRFRTFESFGAKGDGKPDGTGTDDTRAIQDALDWAHLNGGSIQMTPKGFLCGNIVLHAHSRVVGSGRHVSAFIAHPGTSGPWWVDDGNAAKISLSNFAMYARSYPEITAIIDLGNRAVQFGTEGMLRELFLRDAVNGDGLRVNSNVGIFRDISIWNCRRGAYIRGNANQITGMVSMQAGEGSTGPIPGGPAEIAGADLAGCLIEQLEIEAPASGGVPLKMYGDCRISKLAISLGGEASFSHLIEVNATNFDEWSLLDVLTFAKAGSTVTGGILKVNGAYKGGRSVEKFSGTSTISSLNVNRGSLALRGQVYQAFQVEITNDGGTLKHRIGSLSDSGISGAYHDQIVGSSNAYAATPTGGTRLSAGLSILANGGQIVLNTAQNQEAVTQTALATLLYNDSGTPLLSHAHVAEVGSAMRLCIDLRDLQGTLFNLTQMPSGRTIRIGITGYFA